MQFWVRLAGGGPAGGPTALAAGGPGLAGRLTWRDVARVMSEKPAQIARLDDQGRPIGVGEPANLTLVDPDLGWTVRADDLASRSRNTPFAELDFRAKPVLTVLRGRVTARDGVAAEPGTGVPASRPRCSPPGPATRGSRSCRRTACASSR